MDDLFFSDSFSRLIPKGNNVSNIAGYAVPCSVYPGENLSLHLRGTENQFDCKFRIVRKGLIDEVVFSGQSIFHNASELHTPVYNAIYGCNWNPLVSVVVPHSWRRGLYWAEVESKQLQSRAKIPFIVKRARTDAANSTLLKISDNTCQAYNTWGGMALYQIGAESKISPHVSFRRPYVRVNQAFSGYGFYELQFIQWAERHGFTLDYCNDADLHLEANLLQPYRLFLSVGHDEYWSREMRDQVENFIGNGNNVCFFSGNVCWWQIRFDKDASIMTCFKTQAKTCDPLWSAEPAAVTQNWCANPPGRPENSMTGVSFKQGAGWYQAANQTRRNKVYTVFHPEHWVFENTGLSTGDKFGAIYKGQTLIDTIIGYETDAAAVKYVDGVPIATGENNTPPNFRVLAVSELHDWSAGGQGGLATMGMYQRNGTVFTAATVNWVGGLTKTNKLGPVDQITYNLISRLSK